MTNFLPKYIRPIHTVIVPPKQTATMTEIERKKWTGGGVPAIDKFKRSGALKAPAKPMFGKK